jgi:hypothetical protein
MGEEKVLNTYEGCKVCGQLNIRKGNTKVFPLEPNSITPKLEATRSSKVCKNLLSYTTYQPGQLKPEVSMFHSTEISKYRSNLPHS